MSNDTILARRLRGDADNVFGRLRGGEMDGRMKCPGCVTPCEDCDKPLPPVYYEGRSMKEILLDVVGVLKRLDERITHLERIIEERTGD